MALKSDNLISSSTMIARPVDVESENGKSKLKVFIRIRPLNDKENNSGSRTIVNVIDKCSVLFDPKETLEPFFYKGSVQKGRDINRKLNKDKLFEFDGIFPENVDNCVVYESTTKSMVQSLFEGYNCSVFAYGATGAGKTFTMLGTKVQPGITYLTIVELLRQINIYKETVNITVGASYLEVYNEIVRDLLHPSSPQLHLREEAGRVVVSGLQVERIESSEQLFSLLAEGNKNRSQHPTDTNAESSRSHAVFQVHIKMDNSGQVKIAKLSMIDLAGSERGAATGCKGTRFKEGSNINKSLLALGNCINALADGLKHVPYRDSKLTRILKDSLGGNCLTVMIASISPSSLAFEETYNTLKYATRAKCIKTKVTKNVIAEVKSIAYYKKYVEELQAKINKLEASQKSCVPDTSEWERRIVEVMDEKKKLHKVVLTLQSQQKLTELRISYKKFALSMLDSTTELQSLTRISSSIDQLKARVKGIESRIEELRPQQEANNELVSRLSTEIKNQGQIGLILKKKMDSCEQEIICQDQSVCIEHMSSTIKLQAKQEEKHKNVINSIYPVFNKFYSLLRGHGHLTNSLEAEYEIAMKNLNVVNSVKWSDDEDEDLPHSNQFLRLSLSLLHNLPKISNSQENKEVISQVKPIASKKTVASSYACGGPPLKRQKEEINAGITPFSVRSTNSRVKTNLPTQEQIISSVRKRVKTPLLGKGKGLSRLNSFKRAPLRTSPYENSIKNQPVINRLKTPITIPENKKRFVFSSNAKNS